MQSAHRVSTMLFARIRKLIFPRPRLWRQARLWIEELEYRVIPAALTQFADPDPSPFDGFGTAVVALGNGNVVVTAPQDGAGGADAGAVYMFNGNTGKLLSTLTGSHPNDQVGSGGVTALTDGAFDYLIKSPFWHDNEGAVTLGTGAAGVSGTISAANSLVGGTVGDYVGSGGVAALSNGNYVIESPDWNSATATNVGAVTFMPGTSTGGTVSAANSLVGTIAGSYVGSGGVVVLPGTNSNFVVDSPDWSASSAVNAGAVTWETGNAGLTGSVSASNSLVGDQSGSFVGSGGVTALSYSRTAPGAGNYVVDSPDWANGATLDAGAVTWGNGTHGIAGSVSEANSLVGTTAGSLVGSAGVVALSNVTPLVSGNYVVVSPVWSDGSIPDAGAVTWGSGTAGITGQITEANSLVGTTPYNLVGAGGVAALSNAASPTQNYVVDSPEWGSGTLVDLGAVTWGYGNGGTSGSVSAANSLVGTTAYSLVGNGGVVALTNGNYVVKSPYWGTGSVLDAGAVTWEYGGAPAVDAVSAANSLVGTSTGSFVGSGGVTALANGNYVVDSPAWNNGAALNAGAVTWENGSGAAAGPVSAANSLVGTTTGSLVGSGGVTALPGSGNPTLFNYVVDSPVWNSGSAVAAGAVTWAGANGVTGSVTANNSAIGLTGTVSPKITVSLNKTYDAFIVSFVNGADQVLVGSQSTGFAPQVTSLAPAAGPLAGGTTVTISGIALANATAVDFGSTPAVIVSDSANKIVVTSPAGTAGTMDVTVTTPLGVTGTSPVDQFTYVTPPSVISISPQDGPQSGGTTVTISGTGLANATMVNFGSTPAAIVSDSSNQIIVTSPESSVGVVGVTVTTAGGNSAASSVASKGQEFTAQLSSAITPLVPQADPVGTNSPNLNAALVTGLYHEILNRAPDQAGFNYWVNQLNSAMPLREVVDAFWTSSEHFSDEVKSYYANFLGRQGAASEISGWVSQLQAGMDEEAVVAAFLSSAEFSCLHVSNKDFVSALYAAALERPADAAGLTYWVGQLNDGVGRLAVTNAFVQSPEADKRAIDSYYLDFLGRVADAGGENSWMNLVLNNSKLAQVAEAILSSDEFIDRARAAVV